MLPLAVMAGLLIALAPPAMFWLVSEARLQTQAGVYAEHIAGRLHAAATRDPWLWKFNTAKAYQAATGHRRQKDIGAVRVTDCFGNVLFTPEGLGAGTRKESGPSNRAAIQVDGRIAGYVDVTMDRSEALADLGHLALGSFLLGLGLCLALYIFPVRVIRGQAAHLATTMDRLRTAEAELLAANRHLSLRVEEEVTRVRGLSVRLLQAQEDERARIARDLHDGVGQSLTALQLRIEQARTRTGDPGGILAEADQSCRETLAEVRAVVRDLRPPDLDAGDAVGALRAHAERFEARTGIPVSLRVTGSPATGPERAVTLLRILQEALTNVSRHANAREVGVSVEAGCGRIRMEITDDGTGFAPEAAPGSGLRGIRERAALLGGTAEWISAPGRGTRIVVELPDPEERRIP
jgi:signal transduction histidine kinase